ncbi:hypothetical protein KJ918_06115 [Patescibacteria group bacterium]|nr:hypothetical protein [Patescibacteria group bacterium]
MKRTKLIREFYESSYKQAIKELITKQENLEWFWNEGDINEKKAKIYIVTDRGKFIKLELNKRKNKCLSELIDLNDLSLEYEVESDKNSCLMIDWEAGSLWIWIEPDDLQTKRFVSFLLENKFSKR